MCRFEVVVAKELSVGHCRKIFSSYLNTAKKKIATTKKTQRKFNYEKIQL